MAHSAFEVSEMLQELNAQSKKVNLSISAGKAKVMQNFGMPKAKLRVDGVDFEVANYVYLGRDVKVLHNLQSELHVKGCRMAQIL